MFKKLKTFYKNNRVYSILMIISVICIIAIMVGVILYFLGQTSKSKYGNRLDNIVDIKITDERITSIKDSIKENELVKEVSVDVRGKLIYIIIDLKEGKHSDSESISQNCFEKIEEDVKKNYDIQFIVSNEKPTEDENFPVMGYVKAGNSTIKWTNYE